MKLNRAFIFGGVKLSSFDTICFLNFSVSRFKALVFAVAATSACVSQAIDTRHIRTVPSKATSLRRLPETSTKQTLTVCQSTVSYRNFHDATKVAYIFINLVLLTYLFFFNHQFLKFPDF